MMGTDSDGEKREKKRKEKMQKERMINRETSNAGREKQRGREINFLNPSSLLFPPSLYLFILLTLWVVFFISVLSLSS